MKSVLVFLLTFSSYAVMAQLAYHSAAPLDTLQLPKALPSASGKDTARVKPSIRPVAPPYEGLKIKLSPDGGKYLAFNLWSQVWIRSIQNNPGTLVNGIPQDHVWDVSLRRTRVRIIGQMSPRYLFVIQFGMNNQSFNTGGGTGTGANGLGKKPPIFFQDAYSEFVVVPALNPVTKKPADFSLSMGAGLHAWNGVSRLTSPGITSSLTLDVPVFQWPNIEVSDQFSRQLGVFAKGMWKNLAYRFHVNKPFTTTLTPIVGGAAVDNNQDGKPAYGGYLNYQFKDKESLLTAFFPGTYLGSKNVFNIGLGFYYNKNATLSQPEANVFKKHDELTLALDVFWDRPVGDPAKRMTLSVYSGLYRYDFGPNYIRSSGIMNPGTANPNAPEQRAAEGPGNARYLSGTGTLSYTQVGFVLPQFSSAVRVQPYVAHSYKHLQALRQPGHYYNLGTAFLLDSHQAKITVEYNSRPLYSPVTKQIFSRAGELIAMVQVSL